VNPEEITPDEAAGRMEIAATQYRDWPTAELWDEFGLCTDNAWTNAVGDDPEPVEWATREALGLALIERGAATAADLARGYPLARP
jgi:hypothetical protein